MTIHSNSFVSFINENGQYCIGRIVEVSQHGLIMKPLDRCRIPLTGEAGSVVVNFGSKAHHGQRAITALAEVRDSSEEGIGLNFRDIDHVSKKTLLNMLQTLETGVKAA